MSISEVVLTTFTFPVNNFGNFSSSMKMGIIHKLPSPKQSFYMIGSMDMVKFLDIKNETRE